jgi:hypothetical protein
MRVEEEDNPTLKVFFLILGIVSLSWGLFLLFYKIAY